MFFKFLGTLLLTTGIVSIFYGLSYLNKFQHRLADSSDTAGLALIIGAMLSAAGASILVAGGRRRFKI